MRYFCDISYRGTNYHGWQIQDNAQSIQGVIQEKLEQILRYPIEITGSGRTDTGVHAQQQVFHMDLRNRPDPEELRYQLNSVLPQDIAINQIIPVAKDAHARFDAVSRAYLYKISTLKNPFQTNLSYRISGNIDIKLMNLAAQQLIGEHDFQSFSKVKTEVANFNCQIFEAFWDKDEQGSSISFYIKANRFLRGMVRTIIGTLFLVNENKIDLHQLKKIIESKDRRKAGRSVPAEGLYLYKVEYPDHIYKL